MRFVLFIIFSLLLTSSYAQNLSWKKHAKLAKQRYEEKDFAEAAAQYEAAWQKKTKKKEYIFMAAECYFTIKDYRKAAEAYQYIKDEPKDFQLAGLKYARSLKMDGQYDEASRAFVDFLNIYQGSDKDVLAGIVQDEIKGCEEAMRMLEGKIPNANIEHLSTNVNSNDGEFAPVPFSDDVLYYTSNMVGETKMYLSQRHGGVWSRARVPKNFPKIDAKHFGNGSFSPDNKRFYYTQCSDIDATGRMFEGCEIYVTERDDNGWKQPVKLRGYINQKDATATHPFVVHKDGKEILYFVSNRSGGKGGLDIWVTSRPLNSNDYDFKSPKNLGKPINTLGDEITPYYDMEEKALYFSSNAQVNIGGFDIFKSKENGYGDWINAENVGLPFNSSADDYYYRKSTPYSGYIASNRKSGLEKTSTKDDDIFSFSKKEQKLIAFGKIINESTGNVIENAEASIFEITPEGKVRLLESKVFEDGQYEFNLLPGKKYRVETTTDGYVTNGVDFSTLEENATSSFVGDINVSEAITTTEETFESPRMDKKFNNPQATEGIGEAENIATSGSGTRTENTIPAHTTEVRPNTNRPATEDFDGSNNASATGVMYKIQLIAVRKYNSSDVRYRTAKNYGQLETEYLDGKNLTRVLLAGFQSKAAAEEVLEAMRQNSDFRGAVVVRYENGIRIDPWAK